MISKQVLCACILPIAGLAMVAAAAQVPNASRDEHEVRRMDAEICQAFQDGDGATLSRDFDETFTLTNSRGEVTGKSRNIAEVNQREPRYEVFRNRDQKVRLYGDAAIVTGVTVTKGLSEGKAFAADFQFTDTYVRREGHWFLAASHATRLSK
ncbi:MAG: nuclear transport factor 2 family protein [Rudaea sp.]